MHPSPQKPVQGSPEVGGELWSSIRRNVHWHSKLCDVLRKEGLGTRGGGSISHWYDFWPLRVAVDDDEEVCFALRDG